MVIFNILVDNYQMVYSFQVVSGNSLMPRSSEGHLPLHEAALGGHVLKAAVLVPQPSRFLGLVWFEKGPVMAAQATVALWSALVWRVFLVYCTFQAWWSQDIPRWHIVTEVFKLSSLSVSARAWLQNDLQLGTQAASVAIWKPRRFDGLFGAYWWPWFV